jgi:hypothetical protein
MAKVDHKNVINIKKDEKIIETMSDMNNGTQITTEQLRDTVHN